MFLSRNGQDMQKMPDLTLLREENILIKHVPNHTSKIITQWIFSAIIQIKVFICIEMRYVKYNSFEIAGIIRTHLNCWTRNFFPEILRLDNCLFICIFSTLD